MTDTVTDTISLDNFLKFLQAAEKNRALPRLNWDMVVGTIMYILTTHQLAQEVHDQLLLMAAMAYKNSRNKQLDQLIINAYNELHKEDKS